MILAFIAAASMHAALLDAAFTVSRAGVMMAYDGVFFGRW